MSRLKALKGRIEAVTATELTSDISNALNLMSKGFELVENNTALEHKEGGYIKISKRVQNYLTK
tara:strand:+ start:96 stop:287 length:192 start_codon:yes stop_codon:yes gene_type:complete